MKPVWGILIDTFPVRGYRRRPYLMLAGVVGVVSGSVVALKANLAIAVALIYLIGVLHPWVDLCGFCSFVGALIEYSIGGLFVHHLGPQVLEEPSETQTVAIQEALRTSEE